MRIQTFDTTLRDGTQGEAVSFTVEDKLRIAIKLDELGIDYIEGGWPGSNPKDKEFFARAVHLHLNHAKLCAFGATRMAKLTVETDPSVQELANAGTPAVSIFGKTWDLHVHRALGITLDENLVLIRETVAYLKAKGKEVIYDAEHFFDGYRANPDYALETLATALAAGASVLCLCDTNGGRMPHEVAEATRAVRERFPEARIGIHAHNDCEVAVANSLAAVDAGASHVQGTFNGYGERCGNANLPSLIANLELKYGHQTIGAERVALLTPMARFIADPANLQLPNNQAYVGPSAFAHKGGIHVSAVLKDSRTYEHIAPELVGNVQRVLMSDLSGRANIVHKTTEKGLPELSETGRRDLLDRMKQLEYEGYEFEAAEGSFELLVHQAARPESAPFEVISYEVITHVNQSKAIKHTGSMSEATVTVRIGENVYVATARSQQGPVNALDQSLRECIESTYPRCSEVTLVDYKVRVRETNRGTGSRVRVLINWNDGQRSFTTVGVSENILEASWKAMVDALQLEIYREQALVANPLRTPTKA